MNQFLIFKRLRHWFIENSLKIVNWKLKILVIILLLQVSPVIVSAQELSPSPSPKPVDYTLPYPGLLPDHPLYFLRVVRDTVQEIMVSNPLKKAEYYHLQADKGISASLVLSQKKGTAVLAAATASEALDDYAKAIEAAEAAKKQGLAIHEITTRLVESNRKYVEVLGTMRNGVRKENQEAFVKVEQKAKQLDKKAKSLLPAK